MIWSRREADGRRIQMCLVNTIRKERRQEACWLERPDEREGCEENGLVGRGGSMSRRK
jgi:hypothetical protein